MGLFSFKNKRVEDVKNEVRYINKNLDSIFNLLNKGEQYCRQNRMEFDGVVQETLNMYNRMQQDFLLLSESEQRGITVAWQGSLERNPIVFWQMSFTSFMNQILGEMQKWDNYDF